MMPENLNWQQRKEFKSELLQNLNKLVSTVVVKEMNDVNAKIEMLFKMGLVKDSEKLHELRKKMKIINIQGQQDASTDSSKP